MSSSTKPPPSPAPPVKKRGSWALLADMAADMVGGLEIGDGDSNDVPAKMPQSASLPAISSYHRSSSLPTAAAKRRGSGSILDLLSGVDGYDPSADDLKAQARRESRSNSVFSSITLPKRQNQTKKDPLMEFHERRNMAEEEYKKQEARKRRQQLREHDEDKSLSSGSSFFDWLARADVTDDLVTEDGKSHDGGGSGNMKRRGSTHSMASLFSLFGDDENEIARLSSAGPAKSKEKMEDETLQSAVKQSRSVKGNRVFKRAEQAAKEGDWKKAVAYYHIALVKQREYYGEDHIVTSNTLNSLGLALVHLGEHFGALTALEEALHIRQAVLGAGAEEVAETTSNIWMVLKASQEDH